MPAHDKGSTKPFLIKYQTAVANTGRFQLQLFWGNVTWKPVWLIIDQPSHYTPKSHSQAARLESVPVPTDSPALPTSAAAPVYLLTLLTPFFVFGELIHSPHVTDLSTPFLECQHELESLVLNLASWYASEKFNAWKIGKKEDPPPKKGKKHAFTTFFNVQSRDLSPSVTYSERGGRAGEGSIKELWLLLELKNQGFR